MRGARLDWPPHRMQFWPKGIGIGHRFKMFFSSTRLAPLENRKSKQVNVKDKAFGWTPIHFAAHLGSSHLVKLLADPRRQIFTSVWGCFVGFKAFFFSGLGGQLGNKKKPSLVKKTRYPKVKVESLTPMWWRVLEIDTKLPKLGVAITIYPGLHIHIYCEMRRYIYIYTYMYGHPSRSTHLTDARLQKGDPIYVSIYIYMYIYVYIYTYIYL